MPPRKSAAEKAAASQARAAVREGRAAVREGRAAERAGAAAVRRGAALLSNQADARELIAVLHSRGWSTQKIADALGRNRGQIVQTAQGKKPSANLIPALNALADRTHTPVGREKPVPAPHVPPKTSSGRKGVPAPGRGRSVTRTIGQGQRRLTRADKEADALAAIQRAGTRQVQIRVRWRDMNGKTHTTLLFKKGGWNAAVLLGAISDGLPAFLAEYFEDMYDEYDTWLEIEVLEL